MIDRPGHRGPSGVPDLPRKQPPGEGRIRRLPSGRSYGEALLGRDAAGQRVVWRGTGATEREVRDARAAARLAWARDRQDPRAARQSVAAYFASWLDDKRPAVEYSTWLRYRHEVTQRILPRLGHLALGDVRREHVRALLRHFAGTVSGRTLQYTHLTLRQAFTAAVAEGRLAHNPTEHVAAPRVERHEARALSPEAVRRLLTVTAPDTAQTPTLAAWYPLWLLALYTGMRLGELTGLLWADVHPAADGGARITVQRVLVQAAPDSGAPLRLRPTPKSRAGIRTIAVPPVVAAALHTHRQAQLAGRLRAPRQPGWVAFPGSVPSGLVFATSRGLPYHAGTVERALRAACQAARIEPVVTPHELRHTFASVLLAQGRPIPEVSHLLGHANSAVTLAIYAHFLPGTGSEATTALSRAYGG